MFLYPRLPQITASTLAGDFASRSVQELKEASSVKHPAAIYAPTGGNRVSESLLLEIQDAIRECAFKSGFPRAPVDSSRRGFDSESGRILHEMMQIAPSEASHQGPWAFMACILLPDIVRWRFPGAEKITSKERFLGGSRGLRNTFGRVWWRAYILGQPDSNLPYEFLSLLGEDEMVQIMERPGLAGSPLLARQVCRSFLDAAGQNAGITRSELLRDSMKHLRRLLPLVSFDALPDDELRNLINEILLDSATSLKTRGMAS